MEDKQTVSYLVYESSQTRADRVIHRLILALVITVGLLFISNALWLYAWSKGNSGTTITSQDGTTNYIGNDGMIDNGD